VIPANFRRTTRGLRQKFAQTASVGVVSAIWSASLVLVAVSNTALMCKQLQ